MDITLILHNKVAAVCPMVGVSMGATKAEWRVSFADAATTEQRAAAQAVIDAFDVEAETIVAQRKAAAMAALEASDLVVIRSLESGSVPAAWVTYRAALRGVVRGESSVLPEKPLTY